MSEFEIGSHTTLGRTNAADHKLSMGECEFKILARKSKKNIT